MFVALKNKNVSKGVIDIFLQDHKLTIRAGSKFPLKRGTALNVAWNGLTLHGHSNIVVICVYGLHKKFQGMFTLRLYNVCSFELCEYYVYDFPKPSVIS